MSNWMFSADYVEEQLKDKVAPFGALGYTDLGINPTKVSRGGDARTRPAVVSRVLPLPGLAW